MKVKSLYIKGIGGIKELSLEFNDGLNVICGANGIGKTTILNIIADSVSADKRKLRRNAMVSEGSYELKYDDKNIEAYSKIIAFSPFDDVGPNRNYIFAKNVMNFDINRDIGYAKLGSVPSDNTKPDYELAMKSSSGIKADDIKGWFANRYLFSEQGKGLSDVMLKNFKLAKGVFGIIDNSVEFDYIDSRTLDILLKTSGGEIYFEYLSSGYKTCIYIILGILKELEYRFIDPEIAYDDYDGIILIDEIDLHLHPTWQSQLIKSLKKIFSKAQIIATTHSPSILQSLEKDEIIAMGIDEEGNTFVKELDLGEYGLQGWTLEEILQDVMGMPSTTSEVFEETMAAFDKAMMEENTSEIKKNFELLDKMLHPNSTQRKLLQIQMAGLEE